MYFIMEGSGRTEATCVSYTPKPGQLMLLPHGVKQSYATMDGEETYSKHWCHFTAFVGDDPLFRIVEAPLCVDVPEEERAALARSFERLAYWHRREEWTAALRVRGALLDILGSYLEYGVEDVKVRTANTESMEKMSRVLQYIEAHLAEQLSVEGLAELAHLHQKFGG
jgi:AraC family transcriptional regulator of arabinose operon